MNHTSRQAIPAETTRSANSNPSANQPPPGQPGLPDVGRKIPRLASSLMANLALARVRLKAWPLSVTSLATLALSLSLFPARADVMLESWHTANSGQYARVTETNGGPARATWPSTGLANTGGGQAAPAYSDIQEISYSADWVYVRSTGLASHMMGPWYLDVAKTILFGNWPANMNSIQRFPRAAQTATGVSLTALGATGSYVNGVAMFDMRDAFSYSTSTGQDGNNGGGIWNRDALINEGPTFDPGNAHQPPSGQYHYHVSPTLLRAQLGDNLVLNPATQSYQESPTPTRHSPILAWANDGHPVYGPYGYAEATNSASALRRMVSGYVLRDGGRGTANLAATGRKTLPQWAADAYGQPVQLASTAYGPNVSTAFPLGRYLEDYDHLGDLGGKAGADYDLDRHNGRWCVTPEYPQGVYAYFIAIDGNGTPTYPYAIGRQFHGNATGGQVQQITENVTPYFLGGTNTPVVLGAPAVNASAGTSTVVIRTIDGGSYGIEASNDLRSWQTIASGVAGMGLATTYSDSTPSTGAGGRFYRASLTGVAAYDANGGAGAGNGGGAGGANGRILSVSPATVPRDSTVQLIITLDASGQPPLPPAQVQPQTVTLGGLTASTATRDNAVITATFRIPAGAAAGSQTVTVTFGAPPTGGQPPSYTLANAVTVQ